MEQRRISHSFVYGILYNLTLHYSYTHVPYPVHELYTSLVTQLSL